MESKSESCRDHHGQNQPHSHSATNENEQSNPMDDPEEQAHFKQVVTAFFNYAVPLNIFIILIRSMQ